MNFLGVDLEGKKKGLCMNKGELKTIHEKPGLNIAKKKKEKDLTWKKLEKKNAYV